MKKIKINVLAKNAMKEREMNSLCVGGIGDTRSCQLACFCDCITDSDYNSNSVSDRGPVPLPQPDSQPTGGGNGGGGGGGDTSVLRPHD
jgi:natural product precursor